MTYQKGNEHVLSSKKLQLVTAICLIFTLTACAREKAGVSPSEAKTYTTMSMSPPTSAALPVTTVSPVPSAAADGSITLDDIKQYLEQEFKGVETSILGTTNVGPDKQLVEFYIKTSTNNFLLCNMKTGTIEQLPIGDAVLKKAVSDSYFIFEDRGQYTDSAFTFFPTIVRCIRVGNDQKDGNFKVVYENEIFDLTRAVQAGTPGKGGILSALNVTFDGFEVLFKPEQSPQGRGAFYAAATSIPPTKTSYDAATNLFTVELTMNLLGDDIKSSVTVNTPDNLYMSSYKIVQQNGKTEITATLNEFAKRYMIKQKIGPNAWIEGVDGSLPYLIVTFLPKPDIETDY